MAANIVVGGGLDLLRPENKHALAELEFTGTSLIIALR